MAKTLDIERLDDADVPAILALSAEAGWNQTADDWRIFLQQGQVFACRSAAGGRPVATAAILPYGSFAWISMVLVTASWRQKGLGTHLLRHCIAELQNINCVPYLDATPAGENVYLPLGFKPVFGITRWQGQGGGMAGKTETVDLGACLQLDAASFGFAREPLLRSFLSRKPDLALQSGDGFAAVRSGRLATQIGPLAAPDEMTALDLLRHALDRISGPVFLDVPDRWTALAAELLLRGFTLQRGFRRMALNTSVPNGNPDRSFVLAGPEFG
ncbi:MAG: GNAT family N-acetyltransferase [Ferrovibrio sp.]